LAIRFGADSASVTQLDTGGWSSPFVFRAGDRDLVVRFSAFDEDFRKDERATRFSSRALPLPEIIEIGRAFGGFYAVTRRHFGTYLERATEQEMRALLPALLAMLDAIRDADVSDTSGYGNWGANGVADDPTWADALLAVGVD